MAVFVISRVRNPFRPFLLRGDPEVREHDSFGPATMRRGRRKFDDDDSDFLKRGPPRAVPPGRPRPARDRRPLVDVGRRPARPETAPRLGAHRARRRRHRARDAQDRQGSRRLPGPPAPFPDTDQISMIAAKRYRDGDHRLFHRDAGYLEGRRVRRSREMRAMTNRTSFGKELIAGQWAAAEFGALSHLWQVGQESGLICVPYPVQLIGTELMLEFIGDWETGEAAPRLAQVRTDRGEPGRPVAPDGRRALGAGPGAGGPRRPVAVQPAGRTTAGWCSSTCRRSST